MQHAELNPGLETLQFAESAPRDAMCRDYRACSGSGEEARESWQIWLAPEQVGRLRDALVQAGAKPSWRLRPESVPDRARQFPHWRGHSRARPAPRNPPDAGLNFTKGCYLGQEIVERIRSRGAVHRQFTAFLVEGPLPEPGTKIQAEGERSWRNHEQRRIAFAGRRSSCGVRLPASRSRGKRIARADRS